MTKIKKLQRGEENNRYADSVTAKNKIKTQGGNRGKKILHYIGMTGAGAKYLSPIYRGEERK